jgi:hypothetical protein
MHRSKSVASLVLMVGIGALIALGVASAYAAPGGKTASAGHGGGAISGQIESVNADGKALTIKDKGKDVQVTWTDATKLAWKAGKGKPEAATAADLKAGEHVSVRGEKAADGSYTATSIWIHKAMEQHAKGTKAKSAK